MKIRKKSIFKILLSTIAVASIVMASNKQKLKSKDNDDYNSYDDTNIIDEDETIIL